MFLKKTAPVHYPEVPIMKNSNNNIANIIRHPVLKNDD